MALPKFMKEYIKKTGATVAEDELNSGVISGWIDTGCYIFNALISGSIYKGFAANKITAVAGQKATAKSYFCLQAITAFLKQYPEGIIVYYDSESTINKDMLLSHGINPERVIIEEVVTIEEFRDKGKALLDNYSETPENERIPLMMVLDSLGQLSSKKEIEDVKKGSDAKDMTKQQMMKSAMRVLTVPCGKLNVPLFVTAHVSVQIGTYGSPLGITGGEALQYSASSIIMLSKKKDYDEKLKSTVGDIITAKTEKSRFTKPYNKVEMALNYTTGLNKYYGLVPLTLACGIWKKCGSRIQVGDKTYYESQIMKEPETFFTKEVLDSIDEYTQKKFCFGGDVNDQAEFNSDNFSLDNEEEK